MMRNLFILFVFYCPLFLLNNAIAQTPPVNDDFENAAEFFFDGIFLFNTSGGADDFTVLNDATTQAGEPDLDNPNTVNTVWYSFFAPETTTIQVFVLDSLFNLLTDTSTSNVAVYTSNVAQPSFGDLRLIARDETFFVDDSPVGFGEIFYTFVSFEVTAGQEYFVRFGVSPSDPFFPDLRLVESLITSEAGLAGSGTTPESLIGDFTPINDEVLAKISIPNFPVAPFTVTGTNIDADEIGDPEPIEGGKSVWWTFVAESSSEVEINTFGSDFDTRLQVFAGDIPAEDATFIVSNDDASNTLQSQVFFQVVQGQEYNIRVSGFGTGDAAAEGNIVLNGNLALPSLEGTFTASGFNFSETAMPELQPQEVLFYEVIYDGVSPLTIDTFGTSFDTEIGLYDDLGNLIDTNDDADDTLQSLLFFDSLGAGTYYLAVGAFNTTFASTDFDATSTSSLSGTVQLNVSTAGVPAPPVVGSFIVTGEGFTAMDMQILEAEEVFFYEVVYDGVSPLTIDTFGTALDTEIGLYDDLGNLIDSNDDADSTLQSLLFFDSLEAGTYYLALGAFNTTFGATDFDAISTSTTSGTVLLNVSTADAPPANDDWNNSFFIGAFPFSEAGTNVNATTQTGERQLEITAATVWWFFTAPEDGLVTIDTFGSDFDTVLHIYTGFELEFENLIPVANNDQAGGTNQSEVVFDVTSGTRYEVRVGGSVGAMGNITLNGTFAPSKSTLIGDINCDGTINLLDVAPFVDLITSQGFDIKADINQDGFVDLLDVQPFVNLLTGD